MNLTRLMKADYQKLTPKTLDKYRRRWSKKLGTTPKNSQILAAYKQASRQLRQQPNETFEHSLRTRKVRSLSGVTPFAVMTKPFTCPGLCTFCPQDLNMPKSYLSDEPAGQRAQAVDFDPYLQVKNRLDQLLATGHHTGKVELIVIGGTFSAYPDEYKQQFFLGMYHAINGFPHPGTRRKRQRRKGDISKIATLLKKQQIINETAKNRIVGISVETRPDWVTDKEVRLFRQLGVTKVQLGVQAFDAQILKNIRRGHSLRPVAQATKLLRNAGFKICYHYMPNLPGSTPSKDIAMAKIMYQDRRFKPDYVKIYPTQVIPKTVLYQQWQRGEFSTYDDKTMMAVLTKIKLLTPRWCRIDRLVRDISKQWVAGGTIVTNMRQLIQHQLKQSGKKCQCIRCREVKDSLDPDFKEEKSNGHISGSKPSAPKFHCQTIETLGGNELFLTFETNRYLYSLLRLRLPNKQQQMLFPELQHAAIIREIHTFGTMTPLTTRKQGRQQHQGFGKQLLAKAEGYATQAGYSKIAVISATGTRNYYRKHGYQLEGLYMTKYFSA